MGSEGKTKEQWLADRNQFLDIDNARSDTIENITDAFFSITNRLVKAGRLMTETKRRMIVFINGVGEMNYDAKWAVLGWLAAMFLLPIIMAAVVATKQRLGNLAMQRLYFKMSRHPEKFIPKQAKRDPEALIHEKNELTQANEPSASVEAKIPIAVGSSSQP